LNDLEKDILDILKSHIGEENKLTQYRIADKLGIVDKSNNQYFNFDYVSCRQVRRIIEDLIEQGYPIVSTPSNGGGYFWQDKPEEGLECYRRIRRQGIRLLLKARNILRNSRLNQMKMFDKVI
jgi:hypothetical protein